MIKLFNERLRLFLAISTGIFLFILFFQPFPLDRYDLNNTLLFVAGFGGIMFLLMFLVFILVAWIITRDLSSEVQTSSLKVLIEFMYIALCTVALTFYLRYVGSVTITFFVVFKTVLICFIPPVTARLYDMFRRLKEENDTLRSQKMVAQEQVYRYEEEILNKTVQFVSGDKSEILALKVAEIALVRSADNYVEVIFKDGENFKRSLIRNTLKNIELQLKDYSYFIRCHRTSVFNKYFVEKLSRSYNNHWITIKGFTEKVPVSRQYIIAVREALKPPDGEWHLPLTDDNGPVTSSSVP